MKHDSVMLWALAVNKTMEQGFAPDDGLRITQNIYNMEFQGETGLVKIDQNGDRNQDYMVNIL